MQRAEINELLTKAKELLKSEVTQISYNTWIKEFDIEDISNNTITILTQNSIQKDMLKSRYIPVIQNTFSFLTNINYEIAIVSEEERNSLATTTTQESSTNYSNSNFNLNPKYTFDSFVVGNNNRFASAAALAVAEAPATAYNPLFLYGGVGLGKTHLMHAIGNEVLKRDRNANILYVTSEKFTNQLINAIKDNKNEMFRSKYRGIDVLLIDDIQFIAGKERIQEEFFHTFNALHEEGKQIILSSDRPPKDIQLLEDRLRTRFEWGLIADISNPDYETRMAILKKKAQLDNIIISDDILSNIATKIDTNIRELEGTLNKLIAMSSLENKPITIELSDKAIADVVSHQNKVLSVEYIQGIVAKYFNITVEDLKGSRRSVDVAFPRQVAMYLCRDIAQISTPKIGQAFGKRDHSTVMHACNKIAKEIKENSNTKLIVETVKNSLFDV
ncbi:MAG: chromosomal replication initiator protein DnaA [Clostridia bacterium]|nr:chromosomal replication initiator protein DnaA [Clostridia bacterium]